MLKELPRTFEKINVSQRKIDINQGEMSCFSKNFFSKMFIAKQRFYIDGVGERIRPKQYYQPSRNAGHSKWANIKHVKAAKDTERSNITLRYANMLKNAIKEGGGNTDLKTNSKLAHVFSQIREAKLPLATFEKTLQKEADRKAHKQQTLLMKGPGGCVLVVELSADSLLKARQEMNTIMKKTKSTMAEDSLLHLFQHKGVIMSSEFHGKPATPDNLDDVINDAIESGAEDVAFIPDHPDFGNVYEFHTAPEAFFRVKHALEKLKYTIVSGEVEYIPSNPIELDENTITEALKLYEKLTENPYVVKVCTNIA